MTNPNYQKPHIVDPHDGGCFREAPAGTLMDKYLTVLEATQDSYVPVSPREIQNSRP